MSERPNHRYQLIQSNTEKFTWWYMIDSFKTKEQGIEAFNSFVNGDQTRSNYVRLIDSVNPVIKQWSRKENR